VGRLVSLTTGCQKERCTLGEMSMDYSWIREQQKRDKKKRNVTSITDTTVPLSQNSAMVGIFVNGKYTECRLLMRTFTLEVDNNDDYDDAICGIDVVINHLMLRKQFHGI